MNLNLNPLCRAISQLENALEYCNSDLAKSDPALAEHLRAAAIQAFEFTYELCLKMIRRQLEQIESHPNAALNATFDELIRRAFSLDLLNEKIAQWRTFRARRNISSHTYDGEKAGLIYQEIPRFLAEAKYLLASLQARQTT